MKHLSDYSAGRDNNFNLLRFVAASAVLVSHSFALATGDPRTEPLRQMFGLSLGDIAVGVFFATSGFLVTGSLLRKQSATDFFVSRALRVYPGLWVAVLLTVSIFGILFSELSAGAFLSERGTWRYVVTNMVMVGHLSYQLPGTFDHLPISAVNGSLWSLPIEIRMYLALGFAWVALCAVSKSPQRWIKAFCAIVAVSAMMLDLTFLWTHAATYESYQSPLFAELLTPFFVGATLRVFEHRVPVSLAILGTLVLALAVSAATSGFLLVYKLTIAYLVMYLAHVPRGWVLRFNRFGDYSYGIYIYAFAVQQAVVYCSPGIAPMRLIVVSFPITLGLAFASWHLIEKRALNLRRRLAAPGSASGIPVDKERDILPLGP